MKKFTSIIAAALALSLLAGCSPSTSSSNKPSDGTDTESKNDTAAVTTTAPVETAPVTDAVTEPPASSSPTTLRDAYDGIFYIGVALPGSLIGNAKFNGVITDNFNSITCENETKPDFVLDAAASRAGLPDTYTSPRFNFAQAKKAADYAVKNNMKMRLHPLVWHAQTPAWFFTEDYTDGGALVSRDVMLARMESYIKTVLEYFKDNYPGLIYAVDVVNEAFDTGVGDANGIRMQENRWYDTVGPDYVYYAFKYAREYAAEDMKLFYNDYACMWKTDLMINNLAQIKDEGLIDGIGMQSHLAATDSVTQFLRAAEKFCGAGYELQLTELDVGVKSDSESEFKTQGKFYGDLMSGLIKLIKKGANITSVTVWGISDGNTWRAGEYPLLFNADLTPKPAYEQFLAASPLVTE